MVEKKAFRKLFAPAPRLALDEKARETEKNDTGFRTFGPKTGAGGTRIHLAPEGVTPVGGRST